MSFDFDAAEVRLVYTFLLSPIDLRRMDPRARNDLCSHIQHELNCDAKVRSLDESPDGENRPYKFNIPHLSITKDFPKPKTDDNGIVPAHTRSISYRLEESGLGSFVVANAPASHKEGERVLHTNTSVLSLVLPSDEKEAFGLYKKGVSDLVDALTSYRPKQGEEKLSVCWKETSGEGLVNTDQGVWQVPFRVVWGHLTKGTHKDLHTCLNQPDGLEFVERTLCRTLTGFKPNKDFLRHFSDLDADGSMPELCNYEEFSIRHLGDVVLLVSDASSSAQVERRSLLEYAQDSLLPRIVEVCALLKARCYSQLLANLELDREIHEIDSIYQQILKLLRHDESRPGRAPLAVIEKCKSFLGNWITVKTRILEMLQDPLAHRSGGPTFEALYGAISASLLLDKHAGTLEVKLRQLDRIYDDVIDLVRLYQLSDMNR